ACGAAATATQPPAEEEATSAPPAAGGLMNGMDQAALEVAGYVVYAPGEPIRIGISSGLTGPIPDLGADTANGALVAFDDLNAAGGLEGHLYESDLQDGACDGDQGTIVANGFVADPSIVAVQGGLCTGETFGLREVLEPARIPLVSASSTFPGVTAPEWTVMNRTPLPDTLQAEVDAAYIYNDLGITSIALIHDSSEYGLGLAELVSAAFEAVGGTVTSINGGQVGDTDWRLLLGPIAAEAPGLIFYAGYATEAGLIASQKNEVGLADAVFMSGDGSLTQQFIDAAGAASEGVYVSTGVGDLNPDLAADFDAKYEAKFGKAPDGPYHYHAYDAIMMIAAAIEQVAQTDEGGEGYLIIEREALITAIRATSAFPGITGTLTCTDIGDCSAGGIAIYVVQDGAFVQVSGFGL
ncbi:MAG TPA: branched-chain amino acid ABC transporter substrate-binding protein, partial [Anaerolineales bacterium]|nr:branched-chain amino acid ABC transporter substrate-binding protein [Anaerolineales bacterium]